MRTTKRLATNLIVHTSTKESTLCSRDHTVYRLDLADHTLSKLCQLPAKAPGLVGWLKHKLARSRLRQWLKPQLGIEHLIETADGNIVMVYDRIYLYRPNQGTTYASVVPTSHIPDLVGPLRGGLTSHPVSGAVYFGEYLNNHSCPVRVIKIDPASQQADICWQFARDDIKHIHAIRYDPYRNRLWITTGDADHESAFYYTDDEFQTVYKFAGGDQSWRAISLLFYPDCMEWGMDAGKDAPADAINHIYRYHFASGQRERIATIGNPAYAAVPCADGAAIMATTFEPGRQQATPEQAALWFRSKDGHWQELLALDYQDSQMATVGRYGMIYLPSGTLPANQVLFTPVNCAQSHLHCYALTLD
ncbi:hypothetical protein [Alkalimonas amylolytica]|uniref:Uncharacterized protein n=1 Tax=Alkalimonas amylolytica TaxID=152573 RepID=A0A1H4CC58_ALKAM|nr:hypothetical protein [Alkalimonas amylolytica]SEA57991.1 hypothetical protein SAMN04488051_10490 [Alkalimonas amylolytica]